MMIMHHIRTLIDFSAISFFCCWNQFIIYKKVSHAVSTIPDVTKTRPVMHKNPATPMRCSIV